MVMTAMKELQVKIHLKLSTLKKSTGARRGTAVCCYCPNQPEAQKLQYVRIICAFFPSLASPHLITAAGTADCTCLSKNLIMIIIYLYSATTQLSHL